LDSTEAQGPDKGRAAIEARLSALNMTLEQVVTVPHRAHDLAAAIAASRSDLVLILTGSATSDSADVGPAALRLAGGHVERFGMPVDPGNLLFLGDLGSRPVIGMPGCARSPALNGADWVLSRIACGLTLNAQDIAAMGIGGLLKEIPSRPMPRAGRGSDKR
jgi:molybdenum cofactor cytidylyltransferase